MKLKQKLGESGFSVVELVLGLVVLIMIVGVGFVAYGRMNKNRSNSEVRWKFDQQKLVWQSDGKPAPVCKQPFTFDQTPIDINLVTTVLMPGEYRGFNYKPHGGFGTSETKKGVVDVRMPIDATLVGLTRYYEGSPADLQYLLTFENDCGIAFRFDHLYTLSPELQKLAEKTPKPKFNDTRTSPDDNPPRTKFKSGDLIASRVGLPSLNIYGFDFGVYDYRQPNEISKNPRWAAIHNQFQSQDWFGVCWFDMLPDSDAETVKTLSLQQTDTRKVTKKVSDYCKNAPSKTLDINNGQPTDG